MKIEGVPYKTVDWNEIPAEEHKGETGAALNLYIPGTMKSKTPSGGRLSLKLDTEYPVGGRVDITLGLDEAESFELALRIPAWSEHTELYINGESVDATSGYTRIERVWSDGDRISLSLDTNPLMSRQTTAWSLR